MTIQTIGQLMTHSHSQNLSNKTLGVVRRKTVTLNANDLVQISALNPNQDLPVTIQPKVEALNLVDWIHTNQKLVESLLTKHGGILFRNFELGGTEGFQAFIRTWGDPLEYSYRSTPRSQVSGNIYTSTEYPPDQIIPLHNEEAYSTMWPMKLWFYCVTPAKIDGETPLADSRKVFAGIPQTIRKRFIEKKIMYVRNYDEGIDLPWQTVFQTNEKSAVEAFCYQAGIEFEWKDRGCLRTRQVCQAVATHPVTGETVWFNQAHLFHVSNLQTEVRSALTSLYQQEDLPRQAYYGDGSIIETGDLDEIREVYSKESKMFPWKKGDVLMVDNMLVAHGRRPFVGPRKIVVGMAEPHLANQPYT